MQIIRDGIQDGEFILNIEPSSERLKIHLAAICGDRFPELIIRRHNGTEKVSFREEKPWFNQEWNRILMICGKSLNQLQRQGSSGAPAAVKNMTLIL